MNETQTKQVAMHQDFFDRCKSAIDQRGYRTILMWKGLKME